MCAQRLDSATAEASGAEAIELACNGGDINYKRTGRWVSFGVRCARSLVSARVNGMLQ